FFNVPQNVSRIYYEMESDFSNLQKTDTNTWEFKGSDGSRNVYHYTNGQITSTEFHVSIATVKLVRTS
ncbi:MAG TPA: hypothetical protein VG603_00260, partial [Chitinophagales bacterium]|nr:hypothetical protein [Chitinophagales bacterium]